MTTETETRNEIVPDPEPRGVPVTQPSLGGMRASATQAKILAAFVKATGQIAAAKKGSQNPHFRSRYADLAEVFAAAKDALLKHGLAVMQPAEYDGQTVTVHTVLVHESGEWIETALTLPVPQATPQGVGSAITYGRRYGYQSLLGIPSDDDDGEAAMGRGGDRKQQAEDANDGKIKAEVDKALTWINDATDATSLEEAVKLIAEMPKAVRDHRLFQAVRKRHQQRKAEFEKQEAA